MKIRSRIARKAKSQGGPYHRDTGDCGRSLQKEALPDMSVGADNMRAGPEENCQVYCTRFARASQGIRIW
jgi:hypothetical protein